MISLFSLFEVVEPQEDFIEEPYGTSESKCT
jgi:hypothetical protein